MTSETISWPRLVLMNSRQTSPVLDMLATTFLVRCLVGLNLVEERRGGRETGEAGRGASEAAEAGLEGGW